MGSRTHGLTYTPEYRSWCHMKGRCYCPNDSRYHRYGGRGIKVCDRWLNSFENFYKDMGPRPSPKHSIDRVDNNGNYEPSNCRWVTVKTQNSNRSTNVSRIYKGKHRNIRELRLIARLLYDNVIDNENIRKRLQRGWTLEKTLSQKLRNNPISQA